MNCLVLGKVWPEPRSSGAGTRTLDVIAALTEAGWSLHFASAAAPGPGASHLEVYGARSHRVPLNDSAFDRWLVELDPEVVIFDRFMTEEQFGWRVAQHCPDALRVIDTSDCHSLRVAREAAMRSGKPPDFQHATALREIAAIYRADLSLVISDVEMAFLQDCYGVSADLLFYWPFAVDPPAEGPGFASRRHCIFMGSFRHAPNIDALEWLCREIWPLVRKALPDVELHIFGSGGEALGPRLRDENAGIFFGGQAAHAVATMQRFRLNLAPLRFGAGLKTKVFDGMLSDMPTIMTPIAAEGIFPRPESFPRSATAFAAAMVSAYEDGDRWEALRGAGRARCGERFDRQLWLPRLPLALRAAKSELEARRRANFVGQMLRHHLHRSTEYMARWIELKRQR